MTLDELVGQIVADAVRAGLNPYADEIAKLAKRVADIEKVPSPAPIPPPIPSPTERILTVAGGALYLGSDRVFLTGFNDPGMCGHDGNPVASDAELDAFLGKFRPATCVRIWALPNVPLAAVLKVVAALLRNGHIPFIALGDGAENPGVPENYGPEFYAGGFRQRFLPHVRAVCEALKPFPRRFIVQTMNETAHKGDGPTVSQVMPFEHETASLVKSILPDCIVASGVQDTYHSWTDTEAEYRQLLMHDALDIASLHDFDLYSVGRTGVHGRLAKNMAVAKSLGMPLIVDECGIGSKTGINPQQRADGGRVKLDAYHDAGVDGVLIWRLSKGPIGMDSGSITGDSGRDSWTSPMALMIQGWAPSKPAAPVPAPSLTIDQLIDARFALSEYALHADARSGWVTHFTSRRTQGWTDDQIIAEIDQIIVTDAGKGLLQPKPRPMLSGSGQI